MMKKIFTLLYLAPLSISTVFGQTDPDNLLDLLGKDEEKTVYAEYAFKTNRVINLHSLENTPKGVLDMKISHRFNTIDNGLYDLFGLDGAQQRIGFDLGVTNNLTVGVNRNSVEKAFDGFVKYRFLRQSTGKRNMPITAAFLTSMAVNTLKWSAFTDPNRDNYFSSRLYYVNQLIVGRKFNETFSLEVAPTHIHRNLVTNTGDAHDIFAVGVAGRVRLNGSVTFNAEYTHVLTPLEYDYANTLSLGVDIETGGHVFQLHFTNAQSMSEYHYFTRTQNFWGKDAVRFGFNVSRVFTLWKNQEKK